ncbi:MAG: hemerythrin domain-containing protein, partial [Dehalococcoidia bacterium]|nr:hemerythrin domain-containing protein [Dehalococcoidia bacterium]
SAARLGQNEYVSPELLAEALEFVRGFADGCHHAKEEQGLFPLLSNKRTTLEHGPVKVLSADHEAGRKLMRDLEGAVADMRAGKPGGRRAARKAIVTYAGMLHRHIAKEEDIVFPLAAALMTSREAEQLEDEFERVERDQGPEAHERFEAMVRQMEAAAGIAAAA